MLITGCAGFIGRAAWRHYAPHFDLLGIDSLVRHPYSAPLGTPGDQEFFHSDVCDIDRLPLPHVHYVLHLAGQVTVTRSFTSVEADFRANALGTLRVALWSARHRVQRFVYASTNKVFGTDPDVPMPDDRPMRPVTPYGISKATGALYVLELLPSAGVVFHMSCISGEDQLGTMDQGWIGYLRRRIADGEPVVCFGDGHQVRDVLHVDDLLRAYDLAFLDRLGQLPAGQYVIGGGVRQKVMFVDAVVALGGAIDRYEPRRQGDQQAFVSGNEKMHAAGWAPTIGLDRLLAPVS